MPTYKTLSDNFRPAYIHLCPAHYVGRLPCQSACKSGWAARMHACIGRLPRFNKAMSLALYSSAGILSRVPAVLWLLATGQGLTILVTTNLDGVLTGTFTLRRLAPPQV